MMQMIENRLPAVATAQPVVAPLSPPPPQVTLQLKTLDISDTLLEYHSGINGGTALHSASRKKQWEPHDGLERQSLGSSGEGAVYTVIWMS